jgi:small subunit ribosomal protein S4
MSGFGVQLREKQKMRRVYMVNERPFKRYFEIAESRPGVTGENLLRLLETRLDNVVFRMGFADTRAEARQLVRHGHFEVNGKKVNIPSFLCRSTDQITVREKSRKVTRVLESLGAVDRRGVPKWLQLDKDAFAGKLVALPAREDLTMPIREQLIVELYSK